MRKFFNLTAIAALALLAVCSFQISASAQNGGGLKGRVRTPGGRGIPDAAVTARRNGKDVASTHTDSRGDFRLEGLEQGRYNLVFDAKGYSSGVLYNVEVKKKNVSDLGDRLILSTDEGTLVLIKGSVFFKEGTSVPGAKVELEKISSDGSTRKIGSTYTNESGEFTFRQPTGHAKLRAKVSYRGIEAGKEIEVEEAAIYRTAITLETARPNN